MASRLARAFIVGGVFGFLAMFLRRWLRRPPSSRRMRPAVNRELPLKAVLKHAPAVALSMLLTWVLTAASWWSS